MSARAADSAVDDIVDVGCLAATVTLVGLVALGVEGPARVITATAFVLFVPGRAVMVVWPGLMDRYRIAMSIVFSLTIVTLTTTVTLWLHLWDPDALLYALSSVVVVALVVGLVRRRRPLPPSARARSRGPR